EAGPVAHAVELGSKRVRHARLEPADHPRAPAAEDDTRLPRLAQDAVEAVHAPDGEHVRGAAAADEDRVLREGELAQPRRRPRVEREVRQLSEPGEALVE